MCMNQYSNGPPAPKATQVSHPSHLPPRRKHSCGNSHGIAGGPISQKSYKKHRGDAMLFNKNLTSNDMRKSIFVSRGRNSALKKD